MAPIVLVEPTPTLKTNMGIVMEDSLLNPAAGGLAQVVLMNSTGFAQVIEWEQEKLQQLWSLQLKMMMLPVSLSSTNSPLV